MVKIFKTDNHQLKELDQYEPGCWINLYPPFDVKQIRRLSEQLHIPLDYLTDSVDINERSRYERDENADLIVINTPIKNETYNELDALYVTVPIGIIIKENLIITVSAYKNPVIDSFINNQVKHINTCDISQMVLQILEKNVHTFLHDLRVVNNLRNSFEKELYHSSRNKELSKLLNIQKSLVYFVTNLRANELVMMKIKRMDFLNISYDEHKNDLQEDILIDNSQAIEMSEVYTRILNGTMDAFASIISNNLSNVMKRLTSVTIILMVPTLIASFYGMNISPLPFQNAPYPFWIVIGISIGLSLGVFFLFMKKKWF